MTEIVCGCCETVIGERIVELFEVVDVHGTPVPGGVWIRQGRQDGFGSVADIQRALRLGYYPQWRAEDKQDLVPILGPTPYKGDDPARDGWREQEYGWVCPSCTPPVSAEEDPTAGGVDDLFALVEAVGDDD